MARKLECSKAVRNADPLQLQWQSRELLITLKSLNHCSDLLLILTALAMCYRKEQHRAAVDR